ncbi:hypothetical protein CLV71_115164 [Actinophytocola oryzae]|uniref:Uncharacterized protein n=1 Tax=Actinophytocola oryzae TaxID=502181 RepID=A0A4V3FRI3_9PSEU|nr:hypothetical protein CLV71_115164 [Actinophytocola oryzae]
MFVRLEEEMQYAPLPGPWLDVEAGRRVVLKAADVIQLDLDGANRLLAAEGGELLELEPDDTLALDSNGEHRYRLVEQDRYRPTLGVYQRV